MPVIALMLCGPMNDYERVAKVIRYLNEQSAEQPQVARLAKVAGLSESHFHRLFSRWASITPKDFLQCLTATHARKLLERGHSVLDASLDAGLSGPGRLHDLCVTLEAASPGEIKTGGKGWEIRAAITDSPFGRCVIAESPRGICHIEFADSLRGLKGRWHGARVITDKPWGKEICGKMFAAGEATGTTSLRAIVSGSDFQVKVWRALLEIPLTTYGRLAEKVGNPGAARAIGTAVGRNSLAYLIPCHRVIRETGVIGNYRWERERKQAMIAWEGS